VSTIKYYPEDIQDYGSIGIKFPMNGSPADKSSGVFNVSRTTEEQAVSNYINLLLTRKGERYMQPNFGVGLQLKLFEPNTEILQIEIEQEIRDQANFWLPYIINDSITVRTAQDIPGLDETEHAVQIIIRFRVTESGANQIITLFQQDGRIVTNLGE
jgi:phage baseplate assembly protein W